MPDGYNRRAQGGRVTSAGLSSEKQVQPRSGIGLFTSRRNQTFILGLHNNLGVCREYGITILTLSFELHCAAQNRKREPRRYLICLPPNARKALSRSPGMAFPS